MALTVTIDDGLATVRLGREHGNAINPLLVEELIAAVAGLGANDEVRGVALAASGKLFCPGLDLQDLIELDRTEMSRFMNRFGEAVLALWAFEKPMVAAIQGHAVAGGCVLALTADWRVLREGALIGLNELRVGVPLPFSVAMLLCESIAVPHRTAVALFGRNYSNQEAVACGLAHEIGPTEDFDAYCRARLWELAEKDPSSFATTKRYLRRPLIERLSHQDPAASEDFLDIWFSRQTRSRLEALAAELRK